MAFLVELDGARRHELDALTTIGAHPASTVLLAGAAVAQHHAEILRSGNGTFVLIDRESQHGTLHRGQPVEQATLADGDELVVGGVRLRFELGAATTPAVGLPSGPHTPAMGLPAQRAEIPATSFAPARDVADVARLRADYDKLRAAFVLTESLCEARDLDAVLQAVLDALFRLFPADRAAIQLVNPSTLQPTLRQCRTSKGRGTSDFGLSTSLLSQVLETRAGVIATEGNPGKFERSASLARQAVRSVMCCPMLWRGELLGVVQVDSQSAPAAFNARDLELLGTVVLQAGVAVRNSTLLQRVYGALTDERTRLQRLMRDLPDGMVLLDARRRIALLNPRAEQLLSLLTPAKLGDQLEKLGEVEIVDLLIQEGGVDLEVPGPPRRLLAAVASESPTTQGSEIVLLLRDVTEQREAETRSAQEQRLATIGQLAGGVAHDFNNLLAVILNYAAFVKDEVKELPCADDVREIERAGKRAASLTAQLLAFGRRERVEPKVVLLEEVIAGIEKLLRRSLSERVELLLRLDPKPYRVRIDPRKFDQVLLNLAVNARDAMPGGGKLVLATGKIELNETAARQQRVPPGRYAWLTVQDSGTGMPPEVASRIFEPFFTTKERGKGTGLGLATVYGLVQQAGGAISVSSKVGQGTTFYLLLPATDAELEAEAAALENVAGGSETILVAEDEPAVLDLVRRILSGAGYTVLPARTGEAAAELIERSPRVELLLTDLVMPGMGGKELARRLTTRDPSLRVLYMSGYVDEPSQLNDDDAPLLHKPFAREELLDRVRRSLDAKVA